MILPSYANPGAELPRKIGCSRSVMRFSRDYWMHARARMCGIYVVFESTTVSMFSVQAQDRLGIGICPGLDPTQARAFQAGPKPGPCGHNGPRPWCAQASRGHSIDGAAQAMRPGRPGRPGGATMGRAQVGPLGRLNAVLWPLGAL